MSLLLPTDAALSFACGDADAIIVPSAMGPSIFVLDQRIDFWYYLVIL